MDMIREESGKDDTLQKVIDHVRRDEWPKKPPPCIARYYALRQSLSLHNNCLFVGHRIVVPTRFHNRVMTLLHERHPGINRMKALARLRVLDQHNEGHR
ncbi:hypothetical protein ANCDUO_05079 [Ancylostoma duodenale]|uniref:Integrase zinc-binding domain-containing protein n=1 Tax=Ancylostoma duodenale TaxID=51022 RepID=A0A0C2DPJ6_9BILA|nr:hypothetical protein ANCDUO_05079 [Ancylostoma duodenale]